MEYSSLRVPAMVNRLTNSTPRDKPPPLPKGSYLTNDLSTHNNNQPFSYTTATVPRGSSGSVQFPDRSYSTLDRRVLKSPKEVIYASVVVDSEDPSKPGRNGLTKRTVHTTFNGHGHSHDGHSHNRGGSRVHSASAHSLLSPQYSSDAYDNRSTEPGEIIEHYVYRKGGNNKENYSTTYSPNSLPKPKNVTTVLINGNDDEDFTNIHSAAYRTNELFSSRTRATERERDRSFFYGDVRNRNSNSSSSPGGYQFDSSRSPSPVPLPGPGATKSAKLVREATENSNFANSNSFGGRQTHTDYNYMTSKLGTTTKTDSRRHTTTMVNDHGHGSPQERVVYNNQWKRSQPGLDLNEDVVDMKLLQNSNTTTTMKMGQNYSHGNHVVKSRSPPKNGFSNHTNSLEKMYNLKNSGLDVNNVNDEKKTTNTMTLTKQTKSDKVNGGGGIISTLLRRNKDKKENKEKQRTETKDEDKEKEGKIKRQRAKFLSVFLEKNFTSKKNQNEKKELLANNKNSMKHITDSDIEEVERRRDGEYHSWSSGDDFYRFQSKGTKLNRGQSYGYGDYKKDSSSFYDYDQNDYRRNLATAPRHTSATLGGPSGHPDRSDDYNDSVAFRSKSLDRRAFRNNKYGDNENTVPRIIVTPNSPPVLDSTADKWNSSYEIHKRNAGAPQWPAPSPKEFSKSSYELGDQGNLRYFGDTDMEDHVGTINYGRRNTGESYDNSTLNSRPSTKMYGQNGYRDQQQWSGRQHVSRKDNNIQPKFQKLSGSKFRNSSESDNERSGSSQRSVYLHAPAVASIPTTLPKRTLSRDEISNYSGHQKQTRHLARSMSVLSPWRPRNYQEKYEVNYNSNGVRADLAKSRPPRLPRSPAPPAGGRGSSSSKEVSSQTQLNKSKQSSAKSSTLVSRSKSMPKTSKLNWFSRRKNNGGGESGEK